MSYQRIIPRDYLNESILMKCLGRLTQIIYDGGDRNGECSQNLHFKQPEPDEHFAIHQSSVDGRLCCVPELLTLHGTPMTLSVSYNAFRDAKDPYPLWLEWGDNVYSVLDNHGNLSQDFRELCDRLDSEKEDIVDEDEEE